MRFLKSLFLLLEFHDRLVDRTEFFCNVFDFIFSRVLFFLDLCQSEFKIVDVLFQLRTFIFELSFLCDEVIVELLFVFEFLLHVATFRIELNFLLDEFFAPGLGIFKQSKLPVHFLLKLVFLLDERDLRFLELFASLGFLFKRRFAFSIVLFEFLELLALFSLRNERLDFEHDLHPLPVFQILEASNVGLDQPDSIAPFVELVEFDRSKLVSEEALERCQNRRDFLIAKIFQVANRSRAEEELCVPKSVFVLIH